MRLRLLTALAVATAAAPALAVPATSAPYVGVDYQYTRLSDEKASGLSASDLIETNLHGGNAHAGLRISKNFGLELGYQATESGKKNNVLSSGLSTTIQEQGVTLDALGYYPLTNNFELIGTVGLAEVYTEAKVSGSSTVEQWDTKGRLGVGAQYWFTDHLNARTIVRYEGVNFEANEINNAALISAGLNYQF